MRRSDQISFEKKFVFAFISTPRPMVSFVTMWQVSWLLALRGCSAFPGKSQWQLENNHLPTTVAGAALGLPKGAPDSLLNGKSLQTPYHDITLHIVR